MSVFKLTTYVVAAIALLFMGCGPRSQNQEAEERILVQVEKLAPMDVEDVLHFIGELRADREAKLEFNLSGKIARLNYEVGDRVAGGTVMAVLQQEEILARLEQAKAAYEKASADLERIERLHREQIASDDRLEAVRVGAKQAKAAYVMAQEALKNSSVIASFSGSVAEKNGEVGEYYNAMMGGPPVYRLVKVDTIKAIIGVPEAEVPKVMRGQEARILLETYPSEVFLGSVTRTGLTIDRFSRTMEVEIRAANRGGRMKPGMLADIVVVVGRREGVLSIPQGSVIRDMGLEHVYVVEEGKAVKREVVSGVGQDDRIEIVQGLTGDELVVVEGQFGLKEGDLVSVGETAPPGQGQ
jgi:membrane fusion protein (multidrug efflux system)